MAEIERPSKLQPLMLGLCLVAVLSPAASRFWTTPEDAARAEAAIPGFSAMAEGWQRFQSSKRFDRAGQLERAARELTLAHRLSGDHRLLYELGQLQLRRGQAAAAWLSLSAFERDGAGKIPSERARSVSLQLAALAKRVATVRVESNVQGGELALDEQPVESGTFATTLVLDAGEHRISLQKPGYEARSVTVVFAAEEKRTLRLDLDRASDRRATSAPTRGRMASLRVGTTGGS